MTPATLNFQTAPGHQILAAAGKTVLRPGGRAATEQLFEWADFQPGETVLELASSFGESAIAMAKRFDVRVVGVEKNAESVARARENIRGAGLGDRVEIIQGDIFNLEAISEQFDYVLAEAIITMQSPSGKASLLQSIHKRLKTGGKFLSHEMLARTDEEQMHQVLSKIIRINATPLSPSNWKSTFQSAHFQVQHYQTGSMQLLSVPQLLRDEGLLGTIRIARNVLKTSALRKRVLKMRRVFLKNKEELGYIVICALAKPAEGMAS